MTVARSIIIAAMIVVLGGGAIAWALTPRYSMTNVGQGISIRLDRMSGGMIGCQLLDCRPIDDLSAEKPWDKDPAVPTPPPGFTIRNGN
jgi:hypothetical protein